MKVQELQQFINSLAQPLASGGATQIAKDLERAAAGLTQFNDMTIVEFCGFLDKANHFVTTGALPKRGSRSGASRAQASNPEEIRQKTQRLMELYERALDAEFSFDGVKQEVRGLANLKVEELKQIAREMGLNRSFRKKDDILDALERRITERRATQDRSQGRPGEEPAQANADTTAPVGAAQE
jgi:hypothetical protein